MTFSSHRVGSFPPAASRALFKRIASAAVLMPIVVFCVYAGGAYFSAMIAFASIVMIFEWSRMVERRSLSSGFYVLAVGACAVMYFAAAGSYLVALCICLSSGLGAAILSKRLIGVGVWMGGAAIYIVAPCIALLWLRLDVQGGKELTFLLYAVVWAADTGAFFFGKFIGGPKISHALSPSKTWAGIGGGVLGGSLIGALSAWYFLGLSSILAFFIIGGGLGAASVLGDLVESGFKRNFGLKDISGFIPGHGGALDRLDGMIFATSAMTCGLLVYMMFEKVQG
ncbi:phosphatidate cytidylyltransferase [Hyphococcus flavus]|uniref:Phosphatidate cytidylyltransferase n=1 Tax=Hyphococcus flavus TaxID=1866326 RepID=A0AAE9ZIM8_9PROT|nr:phosphatidate cytidylyltransferase [Hyphococcus flavus]WDI31035.1 phosphatidate cytidylyltransferase [Hyphococcus flavus]